MADSAEEEYEVENILGHFIEQNGKIFYLIKWVGYSDSDNTWEKESNVFATDLIIKYWDEKPLNDPERLLFEKINAQRKKPLKLPSSNARAPKDKKKKKKEDKQERKAKVGKLTDMFAPSENEHKVTPSASTSNQPLPNDEATKIRQSTLNVINKSKEDSGEKDNENIIDEPYHSVTEDKVKEKDEMPPEQSSTSLTPSTPPPRRTPEVIAVHDEDDDDDDDDDIDVVEVKKTLETQTASVSTSSAPSSEKTDGASFKEDTDGDSNYNNEDDEQEEEEEEMQLDLTEDEVDEERKAPATTLSTDESMPTVPALSSAPPSSVKQRAAEETTNPLKRKKSVNDYFLQQHEKKMKTLSEGSDETADDEDEVIDIDGDDSHAMQPVNAQKEDQIITDRSFERDGARDWDTMAEKVIYIGRESAASNLFVTVQWKDGKKSLHPLEAVKTKIPLMIIDYFTKIAQ